MKNILAIIVLTVFVFATSFAQKNNVSISENNGKTSISIKDSKQKLDLQVKGDITFTDDDRGIKSLSPDGSISYKKGRNKLKISSEQKGSFVYVINGVKKAVPNAKDESLIAEAVQTMINIGVNGKERAQRIYKEAGFDGVLKEVDRFDSDYVKSIYLSTLGTQHSLSDKERITFLNKAETRLSSDYYKAELLIKMQRDYLKNEAVSSAYLNAVKEIKSDYYKTEVIKKSLSRSSISDVQYEQFMDVVSQMESDYYQSEILLSLLKNTSLTETRYSQTISAIQNMKSSYYQATVLQSLINKNVKGEKEWRQLITYTKKIDSDYYKSEVLKKIAATMPDSETLKKEFIEVAETISSDYYYRTVVRAMIE